MSRLKDRRISITRNNIDFDWIKWALDISLLSKHMSSSKLTDISLDRTRSLHQSQIPCRVCVINYKRQVTDVSELKRQIKIEYTDCVTYVMWQVQSRGEWFEGSRVTPSGEKSIRQIKGTFIFQTFNVKNSSLATLIFSNRLSLGLWQHDTTLLIFHPNPKKTFLPYLVALKPIYCTYLFSYNFHGFQQWHSTPTAIL